MATKNLSWTNSSGLAGKDGPWSATSRDKQILNSRNNGPHAGNGNWFQSFNPKPYIQTKPSSKQYNYQDGPGIHVKEHFEVPIDSRIPGIKRSKMNNIVGPGRNNYKSKSMFGIDEDVAITNQSMVNAVTKKSSMAEALDFVPVYQVSTPGSDMNVSVGPSRRTSTSSDESFVRGFDKPPTSAHIRNVDSLRAHFENPIPILSAVPERRHQTAKGGNSYTALSPVNFSGISRSPTSTVDDLKEYSQPHTKKRKV